jgi:hypothetical protein
MPQLLLYRSLFFRPSIQSNTIRPPNSTRHIHGDHTRAIEYEDIEYCIADGGEKERERERESKRYLSIYSMGDYPNVGCHLTSPTHIPSDDKIPETSEISRLPSGYCVLILLRGYSSRFHGSLYIRFVLYVVFRRPHETPINFSKIRETIMRNLHAGLFREHPQQDISQP